MYLSRSYKLFLKILLASLFLIFVYCLQASNNALLKFAIYNYDYHQNDLQTQTNESEISAPIAFVSQATKTSKYFDVATSATKLDTYNVWCIFTKVVTNSPMKRKFQQYVNSLLRYSSEHIVLHIVVDEGSQSIANKVVDSAVDKYMKKLEVYFYNVHQLASQIEDIVSTMSPHFSSKPGTYYSDALFFLSLGMHKIAPSNQNLVVMMDADTKIRTDIKNLFKEFDKFSKDALFGLAPELTPVYRHVLYTYRNKHTKTTFGEPNHFGGYSGFNSGVILFNLQRLRESKIYEQIIVKKNVDRMVQKYEFKGHLGDQDFYTLLGMEYPGLIYKVDCGWNRQLCTWWRDRGYADVFKNYFRCDSETKVWHGNCNTPIPEN